LYDLDTYRTSRKAMPYPLLYDFRHENGSPAGGPSIQGQTMWGDALYFRRTTKVLKLACLFEIFGLSDCAVETVQANPEIFAPYGNVLDLLTPEVKGRKFP